MSDQPNGRLLGGVPPREMPQDFADRLRPHEPVVVPIGVRPSGPPVPDRRAHERVPAEVTVITPLPMGPDEPK